jgi:nucleotide-binding universal stress UspA family protein
MVRLWEDTMNQHRIVVGYGGSDEGWRAVDWAAAEAGRRGARLHIVHAYQLTWPAGYYDSPAAWIPREARGRAERILDAAVNRARERGADVTGVAVHDAPASALLSAGGQLIVVGSHGAGGLTGLVMGSVSQQVATHARVPVAVVHGRAGADTGPVVVGVDGSPSADVAIALAFEYEPPPTAVTPFGAVEAAESEHLWASLAGWSAKYPDVALDARLAVGPAAKVLTGLSHTAQLVVVGSRGHGGFTGLLLGSVGQKLAQHAECPVLIAHAPEHGPSSRSPGAFAAAPPA